MWLYDGSVDYGEDKHIPLLVVAAAVLLILTITCECEPELYSVNERIAMTVHVAVL